MTDEVTKADKPAGQVIRMVGFGDHTASRLVKDLGPQGGKAPANAVQPNAFEPEDEYQQLYVGATRDQGIIQPPHNLRSLDRLSQDNNALGPCIEAMVTNIDGTGYKFASDDGEAEDGEDDKNILALKEFFDEPWPGMTWGEMRKLLRRDAERTGNAFLEILRNAQDQVVMIRHVDAKMMRLLRLDDAIPVEVAVTRQGVKQTLTVMTRERRYCQLVNGVSLMYFKEFGSKRDLHKKSAVWSPQGQRLPANARATEIMHFTVLPDAHTPYGIPRWINQIPSVLGSRAAEEFNLEYFDNGGVPPVMILLQGGTLQSETRKAIEQKNAGPASKNNRVQVVEVEPVGGGLNGPVPQARVTVERFGADRTTDSMFENYDEKCEQRVRRSFRLPPLFVGQSADYNFACYDAETETLTDRGWIRYDQFEPGMKIACYDPKTRALTYQKPLGGPLVHDVENVEMHYFKGESLDLCVTPKHRMLWETPHGVEKLASIEEMLATCSRPNFVARIDRYEEGTVLSDFTVPWVPLRGGSNVAYDFQPRSIPADDFLEFLGWYISEGHDLPQGSAVAVTQKSTRHWPRIEALFRRLERIGYAVWWPGESKAQMRQAVLSSNSMYYWLRHNTGVKSHGKRVPTFIKGLCKEQLEMFFDVLMAGDGSMDPRGDRSSGAYSTVSKQLADDVQEIAIKLGYRAKLRVEPPGTEGIRAVYRVLLSKGARGGGSGRTQTVNREAHHYRELYSGKVYCFSVPTGVFVTRRNGVVAVQGNTAFASYTVAEAQVFKPERDIFDDIITMRLLPALGFDGYKIRSNALVIEDATLKLQGLEVIQGMGDQVEPADLVKEVNAIAGLNLKVSKSAPDLKSKLAQAAAPPSALPPGATHTMDAQGNVKPINPQPTNPAGMPKPGAPTPTGGQPGSVKPKQLKTPLGNKVGQPLGRVGGMSKAEIEPIHGRDLAIRALTALRKRDAAELAFTLSIVNSLDAAGRDAFDGFATDLSFIDSTFDPAGLSELSFATMAVLSGRPELMN